VKSLLGPGPLGAVLHVHGSRGGDGGEGTDGAEMVEVRVSIGAHYFEGAVDLVGCQTDAAGLADFPDDLLSRGEGDGDMVAEGAVEVGEEEGDLGSIQKAVVVLVVLSENLDYETLELLVRKLSQVHINKMWAEEHSEGRLLGFAEQALLWADAL
jgi:hypothetical protein